MATVAGRIFKLADRQGGAACVHGTRIPVWVLDCRGTRRSRLSTWKPPGMTSQPTGKRSSRPSAKTKRATTAVWSNGGTRTRFSSFYICELSIIRICSTRASGIPSIALERVWRMRGMPAEVDLPSWSR